jgi:hypothetical protein
MPAILCLLELTYSYVHSLLQTSRPSGSREALRKGGNSVYCLCVFLVSVRLRYLLEARTL